MRKAIGIILLLSFLFGQLSAQDYIVNVQQFGVEEGLAYRKIQTVFKDQSGFLWIASRNELQRYDGYEFKSFPLPKFLGEINQISQCDDGWMFLLNIINQRLLFLNPLTGETMTKEQRWGTGLATQFDSLISTIRYGNFCEHKYLIGNAEGITSVNWQTGINKLVIPSDLSEEPITHIHFVDRENNTWLAANENLISVNPDQTILQNISIKSKVGGFTKLKLYESANEIWAVNKVSSPDNLYKINKSGSFELVFEAPSGFRIHQILDSQIWCIGDLGWRVYDISGKVLFELKRADYDKKLFEGLIFSEIVKDESGKYYLPTEFGLNIIEVQKNPFTQYFSNNKTNPLPIKNSARGIEMKDDSVLVNFEFGGLVAFPKNSPDDYQILLKKAWNLHTNEFGNYNGRPLFRDSKNNLWTGHDGYLANQFQDYNNREMIIFSKGSSQYPEQVWSIFEERNHCIWAGLTRSLRKICPNKSENISFTHAKSGFDFNPLFIYQIQEDKSGLLWLCTVKGLFVFDEEKQKFIAHYHEEGEGENAIPATDIFFMHIDEQENRWLGTRSGLLFWNPKTDEKRLFTRNDGLSNNVIYAVFEDEFNKLWLSSDYGIMSFDKETFDVQTYLPKDGVTQEEFNRISHFQEKDSKGASSTIYFGGLNGVTAFHPKDFIKMEKDYARMLISDFEIFCGEEGKLVNKLEEITKTQTITFHPNDRFFRLKFSLPTFEETSKMLYGWKIEGVDSDWNYQKENSIQIGILPYGNHTLRIKGQSGGGWSPHELSIQINVLKPFYLQPWFILLSIFAFILGVYLFFKRRTRLLKQTQKLLETEIKRATTKIEQDKRTIEIQAEELRQLDKVKSRFFANVSHELRTPLTLMLGPISSVLKSGKLDNRDFTLLKKAQTGGKDLLKLVASILGLSKMEAGKMELNEKPESLFSLVRRIVSAFESHAQREGIQFEFHFNAEKNLQLSLDAEKLKIILNNLLSNAIKFTPKNGKIIVEVSDEDNHIRMMVKDTGRGIHPNDVPNIFNRFYQSVQPDAPTEGGTGIGLALSQEFIQLMNGKIWVESELGAGSAFIFTIPRKEVLGVIENLNLPPAPLKGENPLAKKFGSKLSTEANSPFRGLGGENTETILIVEDNASLRNYLQTILSSYYNILTAENGQEALEILNRLPPAPLKGEHPFAKNSGSKLSTEANSPFRGAGGERPPSTILTDIMMPVMDGFQLLEKLKSNDKFRHIPVIMLTARADIQDKLQALRIGVDDYILKPFVEEELLARIENVIQNYKERQAYQIENNDTQKEENAKPIISKEDQIWLTDLENHLTEQLSNSKYSISQLAGDMAISERQLRRRIKQLIGLSPVQYFKAIRLQQARQYLEQKEFKTIAQTAIAVGFQDAGAFSRNFYQRFGKIPSEYLNN